jgi:hypothetical protein
VKYAVTGLAKSGTTGLYQSIKAALPAGTLCVFEPSERPHLAYLHAECQGRALTKIMLSSRRAARYSESDFDRNVCIVRDPRDLAVSSLLFRFNRGRIAKEKLRCAALVWLFKQKELRPHAITMTDLLRVLDERDPQLAWQHIGRQYLELGNYLDRCTRTFVFRYDDMVTGNYDALNRYLGLTLARKPGLTGWVSKIARKGASGDWRNWFCPEDVERARPELAPALKRFGFDPSWELATHPVIEPAHCSQYIRQLIKAQRRDPRVTADPARVSTTDLYSAASDGQPGAMYRLGERLLAEAGVVAGTAAAAPTPTVLEAHEWMRRARAMGYLPRQANPSSSADDPADDELRQLDSE